MAEVTITSPGIFYDDRLNRKMRQILNNSNHQEGEEIATSVTNPLHQINKKNSFSDFDFSSEF